ncbi:heavy metal translocating P-type ATPase [Micromonospora acroterricola]|uniref:Heavy metal translocating P-type ATPase n=1 Tax=Micromonospora acroterricola TaxID=2202421 RepID=A0A317D4Y8_9ACTN|nr:heavy metal translocating P-type ATPase [Micromonospora acroterricola]PWR09210.1 heavy metal translocating P-type ATPase [Micromonospora acroterricola]
MSAPSPPGPDRPAGDQRHAGPADHQRQPGDRPDPDAGHAGHDRHDRHARHDKHAGHHPAMFRRRFWVCLVLTVPVVLTSHLVWDRLGLRLDAPGRSWVGPVLGSVVFWWGGWPFLVGAVREVRDRAPGMMLLVAMAITVAYTASLATSVGAFDLDFWWELAALVTIMLLGHWQEMKAIGQARGALAALAALLPDEAERVTSDGRVEPVPVTGLRLGDVVLVRPGGRVPADGRIVDGDAALDESMITGESRPVARSAGEPVVAGTVATDSAIRVRVEALGEQTALAGIQRMVAQAQRTGGRAQLLADRFAAALFYLATGTAVLTVLVWTALGRPDEAVVRAVTVLVIACPHALGLAIPLVVALSTALAARSGILVKDRLALERMRTVDAVLFDKTGTLTRGEHAVTDLVTAPGVQRDEVLRLAAGVESDSEHPLARAIVAAAGNAGPAPAGGFRSLPGRGAQATIDGTEYAVGGPALLRELGLSPPAELDAAIEKWSARGAAVLFLVRPPDGVLGAFALSDEVRPEARRAVVELRAEGVRTIAMITGDARPVAEAVAAELGFRPGVDEVFAEVLPADKDGRVAELQRRGLTVAMVGDGVNDAPALARADVGIAIGAGTDVAIESAGVVLASSDPRGVGAVVRLSRASYRKMRQNLAWAAGYNVVALPLAAGVLAWAGVALSPALAAVLMSASTIVVALNAQLLRRVRLDPEPD